MVKRLFVQLATVVAVTGLVVTCGSAAQLEVGAARLDYFAHPDGENYFALSLRPPAIDAPGPRDVVFMIDTSASQAGDYRSDAIGSLNGALSTLGPNDRVKLMAVDLHATPLTEGFVTPNGAEMAAGLKKLDARVPLGSTDMGKAMTAAAESFPAGSENPRAVVYIGDGMSTANLLGTEKFEQLAGKLADARIAVSSCLVGPRVDRQLLASLAANTGGAMVKMSPTAGRELAAAADGTVVWPDKGVTWPDGLDVYPKRTPPLRTDRDTVVIGTSKDNAALNIAMTATGPSGPRDLSWVVQPGASSEDNNYLVNLVDRAKVDGGVSLPLVDSSSLALARQAINVGVDGLSRLARLALATDNLNNAEQLADEALARDPHNPEALAVKGAVAKKRRGEGGKPAGEPAAAAGAPVAGGAVPAGDLDLWGPGGAGAFDAGGDAGFAEAFGQDRDVASKVIQTEVMNAINDARGQMGEDPEGAIQNLKIKLEMVRQTPDLDPDVRDQLADTVEAALRAGARRRTEMEHRVQQQQENQARFKEMALIHENLMRKQQKVRQLMERFNSLMDEGRYRLAEEAAAAEAMAADPGNVVPIAATLVSRQTGYHHDARALRIARQKGVVDSLYQVEKSHVPTPDEPPIIYPAAEVWQDLSARRKEKYSSMDLASRGQAEKKIDDALKSPTQLEFIETPMQDVIDYLKDYHGIEIQIDAKALDQVGVGTDTPITKNLKGISLRSALRLMLHEMDLTYVIQDEVLLVTTPEEAETRLSTKVYPVADLVLPINNSMMGGYGGMGGMGMGGSRGMGMGGGMGGMGGGMFNLPGDMLPQAPVGGFRAFAVEDDLNEPADSAAGKPRPEKIELRMRKGEDIEAVWDRYFAANEPTPAAVRDAIRRLMKNEKFDHVIAVCNAALRHHQMQPWMYEVMALSMEIEGRGKEEIERVVMSSVDFISNSADLMHIGTYVRRLGLKERALQVFRQVAEIEPAWAEPYMHGLKVAQEIEDTDGIKWATLGILRQAWPNEHADVWKLGLFVANSTLEKLRANKDSQGEAKEFEAALDEAVRRDCVVRVTWTGDADVDIMVEEPSGTICSLRSARTTSGGVMLGDGYSRIDSGKPGGYQEVYVCPKGFDGTYRLLVRRVWGKITAGKVKVEVVKHFRSKQADRIARTVSLTDDKAMVVFDLENGRRREALKEHQVAHAANVEMAVGRQILAQQIAAAADPAAMRSLAMSRRAFNRQGALAPFFGNRAVGYQPVIITLPEGANMMATAVVSADRRYVRITPAPLFSGIAEVNTFNSATGEGSTGGGTGGRGFSQLFGPGQGGGLDNFDNVANDDRNNPNAPDPQDPANRRGVF